MAIAIDIFMAYKTSPIKMYRDRGLWGSVRIITLSVKNPFIPYLYGRSMTRKNRCSLLL